MGIDLAHVGLLCRYGRGCRETFRVLGSELTVRAALLRDTHERVIHGYSHIAVHTQSWNYAKSQSFRGRSTLGRKKK